MWWCTCKIAASNLHDLWGSMSLQLIPTSSSLWCCCATTGSQCALLGSENFSTAPRPLAHRSMLPENIKYYIKHIHKTPTENPNSNWRYPQIQKEKDCTKTTRLPREVGAGNVRNLARIERKKKETRNSRAPASPPLRTLPRPSCHKLLVTVAVCEKRWTSSIHEGRRFLGGYFYQF